MDDASIALDEIRRILREALQLGQRADDLKESSRLLGAMPELDSLAVVSVLALIEARFDVAVPDDEVSADVFETVGSLVAFVDRIRG